MADERLLPPGIRDTRFRAFLALLDRLDAIDLVPLLVYRIDSTPAAALYALAWQFGVVGLAGWDLADTEAKRRDLIRRAIELHRRKGTPWAVAEALRALGYAATEVDEGGGTFAFRVKLGTLADGEAITPERQALLIGTISVWKPARSVLTALHFAMPAEADSLSEPVDDAMGITQRTFNLYNATHTYNGTIQYSGVTATNLGSV